MYYERLRKKDTFKSQHSACRHVYQAGDDSGRLGLEQLSAVGQTSA